MIYVIHFPASFVPFQTSWYANPKFVRDISVNILLVILLPRTNDFVTQELNHCSRQRAFLDENSTRRLFCRLFRDETGNGIDEQN